MLRFKLAVVIVFLCAIVQAAPPPFPQKINVDTIRRMPIMFQDRYMPLDTVARMIVWKVTGSEDYQGQDPVIVFLSWHFFSNEWADVAMIPAPNANYRMAVGLDADRKLYSAKELFADPEFSETVGSMKNISDSDKLNPLQKNTIKLRDRVAYLQKTFMGSYIKFLPGKKLFDAPHWISINNVLGKKRPEYIPYADAWVSLKDGFFRDDPGVFQEASERVMALQSEVLVDESVLSSAEIDRELHYNQFPSLFIAWSLAVAALVWSLVAVYLKKRWILPVAITMLALSFGSVTYHLTIRGLVANRLPAAGFFESLLLMGWGAAGFGAIAWIFSRHWSLPMTSAGVAGGMLFMADCLPISRYINQVDPSILNSFWMALHVPVIIISYAILAIAVGIAHVQIYMMTFSRSQEAIDRMGRFLYYYILTGSLLLLAGILTGAMWATNVWGTYWGWDPKEVWSLIAFLAYMVILHVPHITTKAKWYHFGLFALGLVVTVLLIFKSGLPGTPGTIVAFIVIGALCYYFMFADSQFATATKSVLAFWTIIMTYVGVNYLLMASDLGKYNFGSGVSAKRFIMMGCVDLALIGVCAVVYYRRRPSAENT